MSVTPALAADDAADEVTLRAYRFCLDPTPTQREHLAQHAGASRWAFNHALAAKIDAWQRRRLQINELVTLGLPEKRARVEATVKVPSKPAIQKAWNHIKGDDRAGIDGCAPWWHTVSTYAFQSAFLDADRAWQNWLDSLSGKRAGRKMGFPKFKRKNRSRDSFRLHHDVKRPTIRPEGYRRLQFPRLGSIRIHDSAKRLVRALDRGAVVQSVTISRAGDRWYASVLVKAPMDEVAPTRAQRAAGAVGVALGGGDLAALSNGDKVDNPRHLDSRLARLRRAQRTLSRRREDSGRRRRAVVKVARLHHQIAERRATGLHTLTKRVATGWADVAIRDLDVLALTASAPGRGGAARAKAERNRAVLDVAPGEVRRQLEYKTTWYGSRLTVVGRGLPSGKACSACRAVKAKLPSTERVFHCDSCGFSTDRGVNEACNIVAAAFPPG